jgi:hypothetical protein
MSSLMKTTQIDINSLHCRQAAAKGIEQAIKRQHGAGSATKTKKPSAKSTAKPAADSKAMVAVAPG